ncbi:hypothetical protein GKZ27_06290 [Enterorhabdus mucosicola]|uniref:N-acetylmuramoyl-L-alanine amidase family protein n=1 Tax=Adlercreutzia mucosicola TaxID=580026 RepID=A0A6N8JPS7_9ACTN|nr:hypothetical protein [Adlercreutzia mucosicola]MVX61059.1 hypothetical protein [Adlercreutzia mucosicola]
MVKTGEKHLLSKLFTAAAASALAFSLSAACSQSAYADEAGSIYGADGDIAYTGESSFRHLNAYVYDNAEWDAADYESQNAPSCFTVKSSNTAVLQAAIDTTGLNGSEDYAVLRLTPVAKGTATVEITYKWKNVTVTDSVEIDVTTGAWKKDGKAWTYVFSDGTKAQGGSLDVNGKTYFFDSKGVMWTGWYKEQAEASEEPVWYYLGSDGAARTDWQKIGGTWYYFNEGGSMLAAEGRMMDDGYTYYFKQSGAMAKGWVNDNLNWNHVEKKYTNYYTNSDGKKYYRTPSWSYCAGNGAAKVGWNKIGGKWYYLGTYANEGLRTGVFWDAAGDHYVADYNGAMRTGWYNANWRFDEETGKFTTKDDDGEAIEARWFHAKGNGELDYGWKKLGGKWYHLGTYSYPQMDTDWYMVEGDWYYSTESGAMVSNKWVGDYYLTKSGAMATNTWIGKYHVNASGVWDRTK